MKKIRILFSVLCTALLAAGGMAQTSPTTSAFVLQCSDGEIVKAYNLALKVIEGNIKTFKGGLLEKPSPVLIAGKGYSRPWTRDTSYNTFFGAGLLYPAVARNTLRCVVVRENNQTRIGGQYWDCIAWVTGAWAYFLYTGDSDFLHLAYEVTLNTLAYLRQREFDPATGLFCGPGWSDGVAGYPHPYNDTGGSSFILDYAKHHADIDKIRIKALSTNCLYYNAYKLAARMARLLGKESSQYAKLTAQADALKNAINRHLWIDGAGQYAYFLNENGRQDDSQEGLGQAMAILFGVADGNRAEQIFRHQYISPHGIPCIWPLFPRFSQDKPGRHCGTIWPQIQGFWALAAAAQGRVSIMDHELKALTDMALASHDFREIYHPFTGKPYGGYQTGKLWHSQPAQTWAATAYIAMIYQGLLGMHFEPEGISLHPLLPGRIASISLNNIRYRSMVLDVQVKNNDGSKNRSRLDDKIISPARIPAMLTGHHVLTIFLGDNQNNVFRPQPSRPDRL